MKIVRTYKSLSKRIEMSGWLSLLLASILVLPPVGFTRSPTARAQVVEAALIVVNMTGDADNVNANTGCDTDAGTAGEQCTLRAAIQRAAALAGHDTITFEIPASQSGCGAGRCTINLTKALPDVSDTTLEGPGADKLIVRRNAGPDYRIFNVVAGGSGVTFRNLTVSEGRLPSGQAGAGIANTGGVNVTIEGCAITRNHAEGGGSENNGAGVANLAGGVMIIRDSVLWGNIASGDGGAIYNAGLSNLTVSNSVINENGAIRGDGIFNAGTLSVNNCTITNSFSHIGNDGGVGIFGGGTVKSTIIASSNTVNDPATPDVSGAFTSEGFNLIRNAGSSAIGFHQPTDQINIAPQLTPEPITIRGVPSLMLTQPHCISPAIDKGTANGLTTDVRGAGFPRTFDSPDIPNATGGDGTDVGALEHTLCTNDMTPLTVNTTSDADDANPGDGACDADAANAGAQCSLRAALTEVKALDSPDAQTINFDISTSDPGFDPATGGHTINLNGPLANVITNLNLVGPGADKLIVRHDTGGSYGLLHIKNDGSVAQVVNVSGLTFSDGVAGNGSNGGGILNETAALNVSDCAFDNNLAEFGGAIGSDGTLTIVHSVFRNNSAFRGGGGVKANGANISNSTFIGNFAGKEGGAVSAGLASGLLTVTNSVFSNNVSLTSGGGISAISELNVTGSTFNNNVADHGGGIGTISAIGFPTAGNANITGSNFSSNSAQIGGAVELGCDQGFTMSINDSTFIDNESAEGVSGAVYHRSGTLTVSGSTFKENRSYGVALDAEFGPPVMNVVNSTISSNTSGGIFVRANFSQPGTLNVTNSTISDNHDPEFSAAAPGIDLTATCTLNVTNSTITHNSGRGIQTDQTGSNQGTFTVKSSIIALNVTGGSTTGDAQGAFTSGGFNLVGISDNSTGFTAATDQTGTLAAPLDPKLDPAGLSNNGGPTETIGLQANSPAVDKGTANSLVGTLTTDQRATGFTRTYNNPAVAPANGGDNTDIGAFELNPNAPPPTPTPTPTPSPSPSPTPSPSPSPTPSPSPSPTPSTPTFIFDSSLYSAQENCAPIPVRVLRTGPTNTAVSVEIASQDNTAKQKGDYTLVAGRLSFAPGETEKVFQVLINEDNYTEGTEFATLILQHPEGGTIGAPGTTTLEITDDSTEASANPIDDSRGFVCQHYHDFLYRQADQAGEDFWTNNIESCGANAECRTRKRVSVSTAFFVSIEFTETGYFIIRAHKAAFGNLKSNPRYEVFLRDQRKIGEGVIVGQPGFEQLLEANKQKYLEDFVTRSEFIAQFPQGQPGPLYVDGLFQNAGTTPTSAERDAAINAYSGGDTAGRAAALKSVTESGSVFNAHYNLAFVLMQYYGYLRRNPDDAPDNNFEGYDFWLNRLTSVSLPGEDMRDPSQALARVQRAEMVRAFIESIEYRRRFGGAPSGNQEGQIVAPGGS